MVFTIFSPINTAYYLFIYFHYQAQLKVFSVQLYKQNETKQNVEAFQVCLFFFFFPNFLKIFFKIYFFNIYTSPTFLSPLPFHLPTTSSIFFLPLPFHLPSTLYINIILPLSLHLLLFLSLFIHTLLL